MAEHNLGYYYYYILQFLLFMRVDLCEFIEVLYNCHSAAAIFSSIDFIFDRMILDFSSSKTSVEEVDNFLKVSALVVADVILRSRSSSLFINLFILISFSVIFTGEYFVSDGFL